MTIAKWNIFYCKLGCFPHPNANVQSGKQPLPRLLEMFPDEKDHIIAFGVNNLATLTREGMLDLIVSPAIPRLALQLKIIIVIVLKNNNKMRQKQHQKL